MVSNISTYHIWLLCHLSGVFVFDMGGYNISYCWKEEKGDVSAPEQCGLQSTNGALECRLCWCVSGLVLGTNNLVNVIPYDLKTLPLMTCFFTVCTIFCGLSMYFFSRLNFIILWKFWAKWQHWWQGRYPRSWDGACFRHLQVMAQQIVLFLIL